MNTEASQDARLEALVEAEKAKREGRVPKQASLAVLSLERIQQEIQNLVTKRAQDLGLENSQELLDMVRAEAALSSGSTSKRAVVSNAQDIVGELQRRSWWWVVSVVLLLVSIPFWVTRQWALALTFALLAFTCFDWEGRGVRRLYKNPVGGLAYWRKNQWIQIDLKQYQYVRAYYESDMEIPILLVFQQKPIRTLWTYLRSHLIPSYNEQCLVIHIGSSWRNEQRQMISAGALDELFQKLCQQAGYPITFHKSSLNKSDGWSGKRIS